MHGGHPGVISKSCTVPTHVYPYVQIKTNYSTEFPAYSTVRGLWVVSSYSGACLPVQFPNYMHGQDPEQRQA